MFFNTIQNFLLFIILFGILVFIHEFGHFIVAKKIGVGVEKFFLGWGKKIFGFKRGETEYGVNWIPIGGYVKLLGEDPSEQKEGTPSERHFMSKSPLQRMAVVAAGPVFNLLLPVFIFALLYLVGMPALAPVVGEVVKDSPAMKGGLLQGDRILSVNGESVSKWEDLTSDIKRSNGNEITFAVERGKEKLNVSVKPTRSQMKNIYKETVEGWTIGITPYQYEPVIGIGNKNLAAYKAGLRSSDVIKKLNGKKIDYYWQFEQFLKNDKSSSFDVEIERGEGKDKQILSFKVAKKLKAESPKDLGLVDADLFVSKVKEDSIAFSKGIKEGDVIKKVGDKEAKSWLDLEKVIGENKGEPITLTVMRDKKLISFDLTPDVTKEKDRLTGADTTRRELGITPLSKMKDKFVVETQERTLNPLKALYMGTVKTCYILGTQVLGFAKLIQGKLSLSNLGGPIMIYKFAGGSYEVGGLMSYVSAIALLSIVLGFINLLPIPILDGGHIFFFFIELIKRKPLSLRTREIAQQFGFVIIMGLLVLAFYNDISRYFWGPIVEFFKKIF